MGDGNRQNIRLEVVYCKISIYWMLLNVNYTYVTLCLFAPCIRYRLITISVLFCQLTAFVVVMFAQLQLFICIWNDHLLCNFVIHLFFCIFLPLDQGLLFLSHLVSTLTFNKWDRFGMNMLLVKFSDRMNVCVIVPPVKHTKKPNTRMTSSIVT